MTVFQDVWQELGFPINEQNFRIRCDQLASRLKIYPVMTGSEMVTAVLLAGLFWQKVEHGHLLWWLSIAIALHGLELVEWRWLRGRLNTVAECRAWARRFMRSSLLLGLVWGLGLAWMYPQDLAYQALTLCVALGMAAGAVTMNPVFLPSLYLYVPSLLLPVIVRTAWEGDVLHGVLAAMLAVYLFIALSSGRELGRTFLASLYGRYANADLVQQLTEQKARAEAASREKSRFLAAASHDLRQPLQALVLFSEALQETVKEQAAQHLASQIGKSVRALVEMFDELLDVSRLEAGVVQPRWQHFELQPMLDRLYAEFAPQAQKKGLAFEVPMGDWVVYSDPYLLERMLRNLISNAIRYTDRGAVRILCTREAEGYRLAVQDSGIGIRKEALPHIFEEYYQVDNPHRDRRKGLGLGLAIVRRIEGLLGYQVEIDSTPGQGSTFSFRVAEGDTADLSEPFVITHSRHDLNGCQVALVEDDIEIRETVRQLMESWGCKVVAGEHADDVFRRLDVAAMRPDILVSDYRLPQGRTALHAIRALRELWGEGVPVLVLTGDTAPETLHEIHASGALLLHKPISAARLRSMMYFAIHGET